MLGGKGKCRSKHLYFIREGAEQKALQQTKKYREKMYVYECPHCTFYHLARERSKNKTAMKNKKNKLLSFLGLTKQHIPVF